MMFSDDLLYNSLRKVELLDILTAALSAHVAGLEYAPATPELEAYSKGYRAALVAVARGAGVIDNTQPGSAWPMLEDKR